MPVQLFFPILRCFVLDFYLFLILVGGFASIQACWVPPFMCTSRHPRAHSLPLSILCPVNGFTNLRGGPPLDSCTNGLLLHYSLTWGLGHLFRGVFLPPFRGSGSYVTVCTQYSILLPLPLPPADTFRFSPVRRPSRGDVDRGSF